MLPSSFLPDGTYDLVRLARTMTATIWSRPNPNTPPPKPLTFGLSDNWSFEKDFLHRNPVPLASYDLILTETHLLHKSLKYALKMLILRKSMFSVLKSLWKLADYWRFFWGDTAHHRLKVGFGEESSRSLRSIIEASGPDSPIFLKADIEDWEYCILDDLVNVRQVM